MKGRWGIPAWVRWLVYGLGGLLVIGSLWYLGWSYARVWAANDWAEVAGRVEAASVRTDTSTDEDGDSVASYVPQVTYTYSVGGRAYRSDDLYLIAATGFSEAAEAEAVIAPYRPGSAVDVYYDPDNPADAALIYDDPPLGMLFITGFGLIWLAFGWFFIDRNRLPFRRRQRGLGMGTGRVKPQPTHEPCRKCRTPLRIDEHRQITGYETESYQVWDENLGRNRTETYTSATIRHVPCPSCGEPKPLNSWRRKLPTIIFLIVFVGIWVAGIYLIFFLD